MLLLLLSIQIWTESVTEVESVVLKLLSSRCKSILLFLKPFYISTFYVVVLSICYRPAWHWYGMNYTLCKHTHYCIEYHFTIGSYSIFKNEIYRYQIIHENIAEMCELIVCLFSCVCVLQLPQILRIEIEKSTKETEHCYERTIYKNCFINCCTRFRKNNIVCTWAIRLYFCSYFTHKLFEHKSKTRTLADFTYLFVSIFILFCLFVFLVFVWLRFWHALCGPWMFMRSERDTAVWLHRNARCLKDNCT